VTITQSQQSLSSSDTGPYEAGFRKYFRAALASAGTANTNAEVHLYSHLEAQNIANSGWDYTSSTSYITISFWFRCSTNQTFYFYLRTRDGTQQNYPFSFTASANNTWTKVTKTIAGNSNLQFDDDNGSGLSLNWIPFNGTDKTNNKALNQWDAYSGSNVLPDMASTWLTAGASTFDLTGVQLEVGSVATDFEHRSFGQELALCQRYFFRTPAFGTGATSIYLASGVETGSSSRIAFIMPQVMRAAPTVTAGDLNSDDEQSTTDASTVNSIIAGSSNCDRMRIQLTGGSYNSGNAVSLVCANANGFLAGDAEL
jgi:hypothetical protein